MATEKKFLNYDGLQTLWGLITTKFATKTDAIGSFSTVVDEAKITITPKNISGGNKTAIELPAATSTKAGLMSMDDKISLVNLAEKVNANADFAGLKIEDTIIAKEKAANLKLSLGTETVSGVTKNYIKLYDANNTSAVSKIDVSQFVIDGILEDTDLSVTGNTAVLNLVFKLADGTTKTETIDVSKLIDTYTAGKGLSITDREISLDTATTTTIGGIKASNVVTTAQTLTSGNGTTAGRYYGVQVDLNGVGFVNVPWTDTLYTEGTDGTYVKLSIGNDNKINIDDTTLASKIETIETEVSLKLDTAAGDNYINVSTENKTKLNISASNTLKNTLTSAVQSAKGDGNLISASKTGTEITVSATTNLTTAVTNANSAVQGVTGETGDNALIKVETSDKNATVSATERLTGAVSFARSAIQNAVGDDYIKFEKVQGGNQATISATEKLTTAVTKANSAVQSINIAGVNGSISNGACTFEDGDALATALGFTALTTAEIEAICK